MAKAASSAAARPLFSGRTADIIMLTLTIVFAMDHPLLQPGRGAAVAPTAATAAGALTHETVAAPGATAPAFSWHGYLLHDDLGAAGRANPYSAKFYELNEWKNSLLLPASVRAALPHIVAIWLRNYVAIHFVYFGIGGLMAAWLYWLAVDKHFPRDPATGVRKGLPSWSSIRAQMGVSVVGFPLYVAMPTLGEWLVERGLTRAYDTPSNVGGLPAYLLWSAAYLFFVEWGIYWVHRYLHMNKKLYMLLHHDHHLYNNGGQLSPFAGLAFHPIDGCLQASPYVLGLFLMPVHFWTHEVLLFFTGVWTANIHDTLPESTEPVMGSKYHTYHHTAYVDNYGQFFVFWDWIHGTLTEPPASSYGDADPAAQAEADGVSASKQAAPAKALKAA